ncbi:MAG: ABC transporter permease [Chloroflexi bacterium]|nr:ABC transporter permease [Chloroflexota bacterium]
MFNYILRRILLVIPTLIAITVVTFVVIQLPAGDYLTTYVAQLQAQGTQLDESEVVALRQRYGLDQPLYVQFYRWVSGIVLRGDYGRSFRWNRPVAELLGERMLLTVTISLSTLLFTWVVAIPVGIYSATHQYSFFDYLFTFFGFVGRGIPNFMIALILMWVSISRFGVSAGGLFSAEFRDAAWNWARVVDLLKHLWVPMVVLGIGGTAGLIRTMRANLLDELSKPYVETARAKGLPEARVLWRYPVRVALNPFVSTVGWTLPALISGGTIVSVVLSLPTAGPLLLDALLAQDMYVAGAFLLLLSVLTVIGTLISDILLAVLDPRIKLGA